MPHDSKLYVRTGANKYSGHLNIVSHRCSDVGSVQVRD